MTAYYVGLMSGTSMDGVDAALVSFGAQTVSIHAHSTTPYPDDLRAALRREIRKPLDEPVDADGRLDSAVGACFLRAARQVIDVSDIDRSEIAAIGSHGQTLRHQPTAPTPFTLQIGDAAKIADTLGIPVVADFRAADIAAGGQGAPLVPPFHHWLFHSREHDRVVVNIGGIANITVLPASGPVIGFDTGPGNGLMDLWIHRHRELAFDNDGAWANSGNVDNELLQQMLADAYFAAPAPKSTGFEYFNAAWLDALPVTKHRPQDVQATLCELTAASIADAIRDAAPNAAEVFVCGGGAHNASLFERLGQRLSGLQLQSTLAAGLHPDWVEACAFAWLARRRLEGQSGNLPTVTGANKSVILGELHSPNP